MIVLTVIGARPQFIKAAPLSKEFHDRGITEIIVHTGQHFDQNMSEIFFEELSIRKPTYNLNINSLTHGAMVGRMLEQLELIMIKENPDWVLVYGDTNSTLAAALAAKKLGIRIAHVEAGLRSFNNSMPEETNRIITDRISDLLFCPTLIAKKNLFNEGFDQFPSTIVVCGDVMLDAVQLFLGAENSGENNKPYIMTTIHRAENTDSEERLKSIFDALGRIAKTIDVKIILHPRTRSKLEYFNILPDEDIQIIDPVGYLDNMKLLQGAELLITDSGGMQKEAFFLNKKCITVRDETEWVELVEHGYNQLTGADEELIVEKTMTFLKSEITFAHSFYGDGNACKIIVDEILNYRS